MPASIPANTPAVDQRNHRGIFAGFSNIERKGAWQMPASMRALAVMGNIELDLMQAEIPHESMAEVVAIFGNVEIRVPPHLRVVVDGDATVGNFAVIQQTPMTTDPSAPVLHVKARAFMGSIEITVVDPNKKGVIETLKARWKLRDSSPD